MSTLTERIRAALRAEVENLKMICSKKQLYFVANKALDATNSIRFCSKKCECILEYEKWQAEK